MPTPHGVKRIFAGRSLALNFLAAAGCAAILFASGCGEVTVTPDQVTPEPSVAVKSDPPPATDKVPPIDPNDPDTGGYDSSFLWKPESDSTGNLVILTPYYMELTRLTAGGETGDLVGRSNGHRQTWRFSKPGARYGEGIRVTGYTGKKTTKVWVVPDGARRWSAR